MDFLDFLGADTDADASAAAAADSGSESECEVDAAAESAKRFSTLLNMSLTRLRGAMTADAYAQLLARGWLVFDGLFEAELARAFALEINALHAGGHTGLNSTAFVADHAPGELPRIATLIPKPSVWETEVTTDVRAKLGAQVIPRLTSLFDALPKLEAHFASLGGSALGLSVGQGKSSLKIQQNLGAGGCFPFHYDSPGGTKDSRRITCLLYLNEGWSEGDGGELELQPFLQPLVRVAPRFNRVAMFLSDAVLHRVAQSWKQRRCLTIWMHRDTTKDAPETKGEQHGAAAAAAAAAPSPTASPEPSSSSSAASSSLSPSPLPSPSPSASPLPASAAPLAFPADAASGADDASSSSSAASGTGADADAAAADADSSTDFASLWLSRLSDPVWQRVLSRAVYLSAWRQSFIEAHGRASDETRATEAQERVAYADAEASAASSGTVSTSAPLYERGAEPLVASLERDAARLERQLSGTGILALIRQTAQEQQAKTIVI